MCVVEHAYVFSCTYYIGKMGCTKEKYKQEQHNRYQLQVFRFTLKSKACIGITPGLILMFVAIGVTMINCEIMKSTSPLEFSLARVLSFTVFLNLPQSMSQPYYHNNTKTTVLTRKKFICLLLIPKSLN